MAIEKRTCPVCLRTVSITYYLTRHGDKCKFMKTKIAGAAFEAEINKYHTIYDSFIDCLVQYHNTYMGTLKDANSKNLNANFKALKQLIKLCRELKVSNKKLRDERRKFNKIRFHVNAVNKKENQNGNNTTTDAG